jgi:hypothetical protein
MTAQGYPTSRDRPCSPSRETGLFSEHGGNQAWNKTPVGSRRPKQKSGPAVWIAEWHKREFPHVTGPLKRDLTIAVPGLTIVGRLAFGAVRSLGFHVALKQIRICICFKTRDRDRDVVRDVVLGLSLTPASAGGGRIVSGSARILADTQAFRPEDPGRGLRATMRRIGARFDARLRPSVPILGTNVPDRGTAWESGGWGFGSPVQSERLEV